MFIHKKKSMVNERANPTPAPPKLHMMANSVYLLPSSHKLLAAGFHKMRMHSNDLQGNKDPTLV